MKYYVTSDIHSYFSELIVSLEEKGFFNDKEKHKLVILGDLFDRGCEAKKVENFISDLIEQDKVILIKGNHEDLILELISSWHKGSFFEYHHKKNGTVDTVLELTGFKKEELTFKSDEILKKFLNTNLINKIIPKMVDYYETENYVFVHGWIPPMSNINNKYRFSSNEEWKKARWLNGINEWALKNTVQDKTIICGHYPASIAHYLFEKRKDDYTPFIEKGIIALDASVVNSKVINVVVIED